MSKRKSVVCVELIHKLKPMHPALKDESSILYLHDNVPHHMLEESLACGQWLTIVGSHLSYAFIRMLSN